MTQAAYDYLKGKTGRRIFGVKGLSVGWGRPIVEKSQTKRTGKRPRKVDLFLVSGDEAKLVIHRRLMKDKPGPGYCHIPADRENLAAWVEQLTAEKLTIRYVKGQPLREWKKPDKVRNEGLDCRVYAYAALKIMQPSFRRIAERLNVQRGAQRPFMPTPEIAPEAPAGAVIARANQRREAPQEAGQPAQTETRRRKFGGSRRGTSWTKSW